MITVNLRDFIVNGKFGPVELGMTIEQVIDILGEPEGQTDYYNGHSEIYYAYYEFFYLTESRILYGIQNDHLATFPNIKTGRVNNKRDICFSNDKFTIDTWFLKKNRYMVFKEVVDRLISEGIDFTVDRESENYRVIKFTSGLDMDFDNLEYVSAYDKETGTVTYGYEIQNENDRILCAIQLFDLSLTNGIG